MPKHQAHKGRFSWAKLFIALALCVCLGVLIWTANIVFLKHQISPVLATVVFLAEIALLVWLIYLLRSSRYRWRTPSFIVVFFSLLLIIVVAALAGVQPLATYSDNIAKSVATFAQTASQRVASVQTPTIAPIATLEAVDTGSNIEPFPSAYGLRTFWGLWVYLKPTSLAKADHEYKVDLFEKGKLRETGSVTWNQPEINVNYIKGVFFHLTPEEYNAYFGHDLSHIFSVSVHE